MKSCSCVLEGALVRSPSEFPYLFLVAFEAGSIIRAFLLLLVYPLALLLGFLLSDSATHQVLRFVSLAGLRLSSVQAVARAVLPKFYLQDLRSDTYKRFISSDRRFVLSLHTPVSLIEPFLRDFLEAEHILGPEIHTTGSGLCTGFTIRRTGPLPVADLGIASREHETLVEHCKEIFTIRVDPSSEPVPREHYLKPLIFHDGRLVVRPTPAMALTLFLWLPIGILLAIPRSLIMFFLRDIPSIIFLEAALGIAIRYKGIPPVGKGDIPSNGYARTEYPGNLYVCSHRTLLDPVMLSGIVCRRVTAVTYSISWVSEIMSPIRTVRLTRCRSHDARTIAGHLSKGDLIVCPEGTTCREPYLLRFSKLFVEIAESVVPVAINTEMQLFHGTSVRGWKALDSFFFAINPRPRYEVEFLERVDMEELARRRGMSSFEIANMIQKRIADALGFQCTNYTRKDKYRILAGNDGVAVVKQRIKNIFLKSSGAKTS